METSVPLKNPFFANIEPRFEAFKEKMCKLAHKNKVEFDEDIFMDTVIKCSETFNVENVTDIDIDNYFWTAFKQNCFSNISFFWFFSCENQKNIYLNISIVLK